MGSIRSSPPPAGFDVGIPGEKARFFREELVKKWGTGTSRWRFSRGSTHTIAVPVPIFSQARSVRRHSTFFWRMRDAEGMQHVPPARKSAYEGARFLRTYLIGKLPHGYGSRESVLSSTYVRLSSLTSPSVRLESLTYDRRIWHGETIERHSLGRAAI